MKKHTSISHLSGKEQNTLHAIKNLLLEQVQPLLIYCFNSTAVNTVQRNCFRSSKRTEEFNFSADLLVVVMDESPIDDTRTKEIETLAAALGKVRLDIHTLAVTKKLLEERSLFFSWVHRTAIVLYQRGNTMQLLPPRIAGLPEYRQQVEQFLIKYPDIMDYLPEKLVTIKPATETQKAQPQQITIQLLLEVKDGAIQVATLPQK